MTIFEHLAVIIIANLAAFGVLSVLMCYRKKLPATFPYPLACGIVAGVICLMLSIMISN